MGHHVSLIENETHLNYYCNEGFNNCCSGSSTVSLKDAAVTSNLQSHEHPIRITLTYLQTHNILLLRFHLHNFNDLASK